MNNLLAFNLLVVFLLFYSCCDNATNNEYLYVSVTMDEIYQNKITNYVDSLINLETKVYWRNAHGSYDSSSDSLYASLLKLKFENADNYITDDKFKNQLRGDLFIISQHINKRWNGLVEKYYFKNDSLSNCIKTYIFQGRIQFREWLNVSEDRLKDTVFLNQSNNITYWSQTFEFQIDDILDKY